MSAFFKLNMTDFTGMCKCVLSSLSVDVCLWAGSGWDKIRIVFLFHKREKSPLLNQIKLINKLLLSILGKVG